MIAYKYHILIASESHYSKLGWEVTPQSSTDCGTILWFPTIDKIRASTKGRNLAFVPVRAFLKLDFGTDKGTFLAQTGTIVHARNFFVLFRP